MYYFKDSDGKIHCLEDKKRVALLPPGCVEISEAAALAVLNQPPADQDLLIGKICVLEAAITPRRLREAVVGTDGGWLIKQEAEIEALRVSLRALLAEEPI